MKYTLSNTINRPMAEVMQKFKDPGRVKHWMEGLEKIEHISGVPGEVGARERFLFFEQGQSNENLRDHLEQNLPRQIKFGYQSGMGI